MTGHLTGAGAPAVPTWEGHEAYVRGMRRVFALYQAPSVEMRTLIACAMLVRDSTTLLTGIYGTGKTQLVRLLSRVFFGRADGRGSDLGQISCTQDLTPLDTLFSLDLARLTQGEEIVTPRAIVTARLKFVNEAQRANAVVYNALLPLLAEKRVAYRDQAFDSPDFVCLMDANPLDVGSAEMPRAFRDRIDFSFDVPLLSGAGVANLHAAVERGDGPHWGALAELAEPAMTAGRLEACWADVRRVTLPPEATLFVSLIGGFLQACAHADRSRVSADFELPCRDCVHRPEVCSKLVEIPGTRFQISLMKLAQARAWLRRSREVEVDDLLYGLPYVLAHRLQLKAETLRLFPSVREWICEELYRRRLRGRVPRWRQAVDMLRSGQEPEPGVLRELASRDLAIARLSSRA
jgi:MoxR-like ATPase